MQLPATVEGKQGKCPSCNAVVTVTNNGMVDLASLQQQPIPQQPEPSPTHPVQQQSDVQQPAATKDVPLEMGKMRFAENNLTPGEYILHAGRSHPYLKWIVIVFVLVVIVGTVGLMPSFGGRGWKGNPLVFAAVINSLLVLRMVYEYLWLRTVELVLTNTRIFFRRGILFIKVRDVRLDKVGTVDFRQGFIEWLTGSGRITVRDTGGMEVGSYPYLADALEFRRRILAQIDRVKT
jgi:membrane protein YdbS with pleckstrin-like domain